MSTIKLQFRREEKEEDEVFHAAFIINGSSLGIHH